MTHRVTQVLTQPVTVSPANARVSQVFAQPVLADKTLPIRVTQLFAQAVGSIQQGIVADFIPSGAEEFIGVEALEQPPLPRVMIEDRERNPYPAHIEAVDVAEQQRVIREQHNTTQAGDTTFDYGLLLKGTPTQLYTMGSLGRFYHDDYGMIHARYVQFMSCVDTEAQGVPVGRLKAAGDFKWIVTNDFEKSGTDLVAGVIALAETPADGSFGWMIVDGICPADMLPGDGTLPLPDDEYVWNQTGRVKLNTAGRVVARRASAGDALIPAGAAYIRVEGPSKTAIGGLASGNSEDLNQLIADLTARLQTAESQLNQLSTATASDLTLLEQQLQNETNSRARDVTSIRKSLPAQGVGEDMVVSAIGDLREEIRLELQTINEQISGIGYVGSVNSQSLSSLDTEGLRQIGAIGTQLAALSGRLRDFYLDLTTPPTNGQALIFDSSTGKWKPGTIAGGGGALNDLSDVDTVTTPPATGNVLGFNGTQWVPTVPTGGSASPSAYAAVIKNANQTIGGAITTITYQTVLTDTNGIWNAATNSFIIPSSLDGKVAVLSFQSQATSDSNGFLEGWIERSLDGGSTWTIVGWSANGGIDHFGIASSAFVDRLVTGARYRVQIQIQAGATLLGNNRNRFAIGVVETVSGSPEVVPTAAALPNTVGTGTLNFGTRALTVTGLPGTVSGITGRSVNISSGFVATARILGRAQVNFNSIGMFATNGTAYLYFSLLHNNSPVMVIEEWTNRTTFSTQAVSTSAAGHIPDWYRMVYNSSAGTIQCQFSYTGDFWLNLGGTSSFLGTGVTAVGVGANRNNSTASATAQILSWQLI